MHIAICDDDQKDLLQLKELVQEYNPNIDISTYESAQKLLDGFRENQCDIVLLDIMMEGVNGIDAAKMLTEAEYPPLVIFITNDKDCASDVYGIAYQFLCKPVCYAKLEEILTEAIAKISPNKIMITVDKLSHIIPVKEILCIESNDRNISIHKTENNLDCKMTLAEIENMLPENVFFSPHKGYLVNLEHVDCVDNTLILLKDGSFTPISRRRKQEFNNALNRYIRGKV